MTILIHPNSGEKKSLDNVGDFFGSLILGPLYFLFNGLVGWFFLAILLNLFTFGLAWIPLSFFAHSIRKSGMFAKGWMTIEIHNRRFGNVA